ncbi:MAG: TonB-dependent receptor [Chitinophagaceae bacterium]|nr:TonB-dependent receptor [Chitinophagaceae bacterium]MCW5925697.1 TonB-dependent receptor [Chitinophagaceae bacterium]
MKFISFFLFVICMQASASVSAQKVTLDEKNASVQKVLREIRKQTDFDFLVNARMLKKGQTLNISVKDMPLENVLKLMFQNLPIDYVVDNKTIIIRDKSENTGVSDFRVSGIIISDRGEPLAGVSIIEKGTQNGVTSNESGRFSISVKNEAAILQITSIGYISKEVRVASGEMTILLESDNSSLTDVVVVGYGTLKKSDLTGSISQVRGADLTQLPTQRVDQALQGRAAGVLVLNTDGAPGGNTTIRVRGMNSINGGNNALIVIDGLQGGNLNSLNPNDIESIEILKDASATAIYGSQGANGVILITTKMGRRGRPVVDYSYNLGYQELRKKLDVMNAADYARTVNAYRQTQNLAGTPVMAFTDQQIAEFEKTGGTDWQDEIYRTGSLQNHQLSVGGGTDNTKYMVSAGYLDQQGILINSDYKRFSLRANINSTVTKNVSFGLNWAASKEQGSSPPYGSNAVSFLGQAVNGAPRWDPTTPVYDQDGNYNTHPGGYGAYDVWNPVAAAKEPFTENNTVRNTINTFLDFKIIEGLTLRVTGGAIIRNVNNTSYFNSKTFEGRPTQGMVGYGTAAENLSTRYQNSNILTYTKQFSKHNLTVMGVVEQQYENYKGSSLTARKFTVDQTGINDLGGASEVFNASAADKRTIYSYLGRVNYSFNERYLLTVSYRADGSSVFGKNNKWGYFPAASVAWRLSEESFIKDLDLFSELKLRGSWGITGNQAISPFQTLARMTSGGNYPYSGNDNTDLGFFISSAANPSLKWENTMQSDIGLDMGLFNDRIQFTVDLYKKTTRDLLLSRELPGYTGLTSIIDNVGSVENRGLELSVSGDPVRGEVRWNTGFNISFNRNKVLDLGANDRISYRTTMGGYGVNTNFMFLVKGQPFGQMYGYGYEGTWSEKDAATAASYGQLPGDPRYTDLNNDGSINTQDLKVIGNAFPDYIFGWTNRVTYKNFELVFLIQGTRGNDIFNQARIRLENPFEAVSARILDRWTPDNQNTDVPAFIDQVTRQNAGLTSKVFISGDQRLSRWVEDGSYIRLKNISIGYDIPNSAVRRIGLSKAKVFVTGANVFTITKYTGYDPEVSAYTGNDAQLGVDLSSYPASKSITFGINLSF